MGGYTLEYRKRICSTSIGLTKNDITKQAYIHQYYCNRTYYKNTFFHYFLPDEDDDELPAPPPEVAKAKVEETLLDLKSQPDNLLNWSEWREIMLWLLYKIFP